MNNPRDEGLLCKEKELICEYNSILSSGISLLQQQCKQDWVKYGDISSRFFFAKAKQRKLATFIYSIKDDTRSWTEGFDKVGQVMVDFYKKLLGGHPQYRSPIE